MSEYTGEDRRAPLGWHLKKEFNVGHLFTTLTLAIGLIAWGNKMDQRVTRMEMAQEAQHEAVAISERSFTARLDRIDDKLDRIIERQQVR